MYADSLLVQNFVRMCIYVCTYYVFNSISISQIHMHCAKLAALRISYVQCTYVQQIYRYTRYIRQYVGTSVRQCILTSFGIYRSRVGELRVSLNVYVHMLNIVLTHTHTHMHVHTYIHIYRLFVVSIFVCAQIKKIMCLSFTVTYVHACACVCVCVGYLFVCS